MSLRWISIQTFTQTFPRLIISFIIKEEPSDFLMGMWPRYIVCIALIVVFWGRVDHCVGYLWVDETVVEPVDAATPWTTDMTSSLVDGVNTYGGDQWLAISLSDKYNFPAAITPSVMADQWQQMIRDGEVVLHCEYRLKENLREAVSHQLTDIGSLPGIHENCIKTFYH